MSVPVYLSSGLNASSEEWQAYFLANPSAKKKAWDAMMDADRAFDKKNGTEITNAIWKELYEGVTKS